MHFYKVQGGLNLLLPGETCLTKQKTLQYRVSYDTFVLHGTNMILCSIFF